MAPCTQAVILAAGIGSRLRPITLRKPKCCVRVDSRPILAHQLRAYAAAGVTRVYVIAGYMRGQVARLCSGIAADIDGFSVDVIENEIYANTDNLYSLWLAREAVDGESFLLSNGDVVFDPSLVERVATADGGTVISCDAGTYSEESMKVTVDGDGRIDHISKGISEDEAYAVSTDLYRFSASFSGALFDEIGRIIENRAEYTGWTEVAIDDLLSAGHDARPIDVSGLRWVEIDDYDDLTEADKQFGSFSGFAEREAVFFDLDGTIYLDDELVEGAAEVVERLRSSGVAVYFLSNNSSKWKTDYADRLTRLGIDTTPDEVLLSTDGVIQYLRDKNARRVYVVGTDTMRDAMRDRGVDVVEDVEEEPRHVVVGFDTQLTYEKVQRATLAIHDGAEFLLAHPDPVCPTVEGFIPDCGAIGALIEVATDRQPARVFGKPNPEMITNLMDEQGLSPESVVVVGDRLETELRMATDVGCDAICVLTGDADRVDVEESEIEPSLVVPTVGELSSFI